MAKKIILTDFHLPTSADGVDGLLHMAEAFGAAETLHFLSIGYGKGSPVAEARQILAARLVKDHMVRNKDTTYTQARRAVGNEQGFRMDRLSNFQRVADLGRELLRTRGEWPFDDTRDA